MVVPVPLVKGLVVVGAVTAGVTVPLTTLSPTTSITEKEGLGGGSMKGAREIPLSPEELRNSESLKELDSRGCKRLYNPVGLKNDPWFNALYACPKRGEEEAGLYYLKKYHVLTDKVNVEESSEIAQVEGQVEVEKETKSEEKRESLLKKVVSLSYEKKGSDDAELSLNIGEKEGNVKLTVALDSGWRYFEGSVDLKSKCKVELVGGALNCRLPDREKGGDFTWIFSVIPTN